jgi:DNA polymerase-1
LNEIKPAVREKLEKSKESAYLSQKLATLVANIPLKFTLKSARWNQKSLENLIPLFQEYNFRSLITRANKKFTLKSKKLPQKTQTDPNQTSLF